MISLLSAQDWGRPGDLWNLDIQWHVPSMEETAFVFYILDLLLQPELQRLQKFAQGEQDMSRSEVNNLDRSFIFVLYLIIYYIYYTILYSD